MTPIPIVARRVYPGVSFVTAAGSLVGAPGTEDPTYLRQLESPGTARGRQTGLADLMRRTLVLSDCERRPD